MWGNKGSELVDELNHAVQRMTSRSNNSDRSGTSRSKEAESQREDNATGGSDVIDMGDVKWGVSQLPQDYYQIPEGLEQKSYQTGYAKALWQAVNMSNPTTEELGAIKSQLKLVAQEVKGQGKKFQEVVKEQLYQKTLIEELQNKARVFEEFDLETFHSLNLAMVELVRRGRYQSGGGIGQSVSNLFASMWAYLRRTLTDAEIAVLILSRKILLIDLWSEMGAAHDGKKGRNEVVRKAYGVIGSGCYVGGVEAIWFTFNRFNDKLPEFMQKGIMPMKVVLGVWVWALRGSAGIVLLNAFINAWRGLLTTARKERIVAA
eukprot:TRINITY_DN4070_c0_g1_i2.p1 TRINITY_DN4070_c0_g1~~TRINITY_DN4070_c0_g1_i2.p1  ORF type:complete len:318 (+),score=45.95 TRINITY_DN4070_c0_g1_i2:25-978(+)